MIARIDTQILAQKICLSTLIVESKSRQLHPENQDSAINFAKVESMAVSDCPTLKSEIDKL